MLTTEQLIEAIARAILRAYEIYDVYGPAAAELYLRRLQLKMRMERPLPLHTLN